jgi:transcriptional regulator with XRE-family HTH domain
MGKNLSQEDLAKALGVEQNYVSRFENDKTKNPTIDTIERFADALEVHPSQILYTYLKTFLWLD